MNVFRTRLKSICLGVSTLSRTRWVTWITIAMCGECAHHKQRVCTLERAYVMVHVHVCVLNEFGMSSEHVFMFACLWAVLYLHIAFPPVAVINIAWLLHNPIINKTKKLEYLLFKIMCKHIRTKLYSDSKISKANQGSCAITEFTKPNVVLYSRS